MLLSDVDFQLVNHDPLNVNFAHAYLNLNSEEAFICQMFAIVPCFLTGQEQNYLIIDPTAWRQKLVATGTLF